MSKSDSAPSELEQERRLAMRRLQRLAESMQDLNLDLTPEETEQIADEISRETIERMAAEGKITFSAASE